MAKPGTKLLLVFSLGLSFLMMGLSFLMNGCKTGDSNVNRSPQAVAPDSPAHSMNSVTPIRGPIRYLALGDSTGVGVGAQSGGYPDRLFRRIVSLRAESKLINLCVSGATSSDVLDRQMKRVAEAGANLVTLGVGINDIGRGVPIDVFERNYDQILSQLKVSTSAQIVVTNIPEISSAPRIPIFLREQYRAQIKEYNQRLEEVAERHGVVVFDVHTITGEKLAAHPEYFSADGFHPSDEGYALWADTMWPTIAKIMGEAAST